MTTAKFNASLDLNKINRDNPDMKYNPNKFSSAVWRGGHGTLQLFSNGKVIHSGRPREISPEQCIEKYAQILRDQGHPVWLSDVRTVSRSGVYRLHGRINISAIPGGDYEPEIFNAAFLKCGGMAFSIFHTGCVVITGIQHTHKALEVLLQLEEMAY